ncbi:MAG: rubrerythrin [Desulfobacteraceae bacterium 4572_123]|nr:MAG: rubrerythrin [Desulfobacteraceae bacterium 4572_123]
MNFQSINEILEYAIKKEVEAAEFYEDLSRQEPFAGAGEMFEEFAAEERRHQTMLENFSTDKEKISAYQFKWVPDMKRSDYMVDLTYEPGMGYADILRLAMKREEKALKLYNDLAKKTDDKAGIQVFKLLSQEEAKHKQFLETMYDDFMASQGD